jgi:type IX secretion system PorP/SprF family membrane protein
LNPALTGTFDGQLRASAIYRNQWGNVSTPFATPGVSLDMNTEKKINFGVNLMRQSAGTGGYTYTTATGNIAYTGVRFDNETKRVVFGMQAGIIQKRFDATKLTFGDQWNPVTGLTSNPTADVLRNNNTSSLDIGAGVMYFDGAPNKKANLFLGYSASHINRPKDQFKVFGDAKVPLRHTLHGGVKLKASEKTSVTPNVLYLKQGTASEKMIGLYAETKLNATNEIMYGTNFRLGDAITPFVGFTFNNTMLSASYDINISDLGRLAKGTNSFEISLTFIKRKAAKTPEAEFICPRL